MTTARAEYSSVLSMPLNDLAAVGRVPERAGDVRAQAVRVRCGDRADRVGGLRRVVPAFLAQIDRKDALGGSAISGDDRAHDRAGHDTMHPGERPGVRGCLGPVRGGQTRGTLINDDPREDVRRLETRLHLKNLGRLRLRGQPSLRVILLRTGELSRQRERDDDHDPPEGHHKPLGPAPGRNLCHPSRCAHRVPRQPNTTCSLPRNHWPHHRARARQAAPHNRASSLSNHPGGAAATTTPQERDSAQTCP